MDVYVLGDPHLRIGGRERPFPAGRPGRLLASLLVARGRVVTDDRLVDDVWGEDLPVDARAALHTTVGRARRALGPEGTRIGRTAVGYRLDLTGVDVDADRFAAALARARALEDGGRLAAYDEALALWRGPAWAGLAVDVAQGEALRLEEAHVAAREERAEVLLALGRAREAADELRQLVTEHPLRDRPSLLLMRALHRLGASADALAVYAVHRQALADELGLDPSPELDEAQRDILERTPDPAPSSGKTPATTGETTGDRRADIHRPRPRADEAGSSAGDDDIEQVRALTARHQCVTVVGPGGVGKTSLARAVAAAEQVAWWADLTSVSTEAGVRAVVATALGVEVFPGGSAEAALHRRLETATGLLVLDNCEHVLATVGDLTTGIAAFGAGVRVLATSRERLGLQVEQVYPLAPLRLPGAGAAADADVPSVALFLERAHASAPDLEATPDVVRDVAELVRRLDGLPLAIELAASRVGVVSLATLRDRLDDRLDLLRSHHRRGPARHQTLVDTIDWSYDLLDEDHRRALRWLSVFSGPFDLDAAEAVLGPDSTEQVLGLVERSLLVRPAATQGGYRMLETVRAYARALLDDGERHEVGLAHARWAADASRGGSCRDGGSRRGVVDRAGRGPAAGVRPGGLLGSRDRPGRGGDAHRPRPVPVGREPGPRRRHGLGMAPGGVGARWGPHPGSPRRRLVVLVDGGRPRARGRVLRPRDRPGGRPGSASRLSRPQRRRGHRPRRRRPGQGVGGVRARDAARDERGRLERDRALRVRDAPRPHLRRAGGHRRDHVAARLRKPGRQPDDPGHGAVRRGRSGLRHRAATRPPAVRGRPGAGPYDRQPAGTRGRDGRRDGPARAGGSSGRRDGEQDRRCCPVLAGLGQREPLRHLSAQRGLAPRPARRPPSGRRAGGDDDHPDA